MATQILIADDEQEIREEIIECLAANGFECVEAPNGEEGLDILRRDTEITIVLIDILMPGKSGLEMIHAAQVEFSTDRHLEFIVLTGHGGSGEAIGSDKLTFLDPYMCGRHGQATVLLHSANALTLRSR